MGSKGIMRKLSEVLFKALLCEHSIHTLPRLPSFDFRLTSAKHFIRGILVHHKFFPRKDPPASGTVNVANCFVALFLIIGISITREIYALLQYISIYADTLPQRDPPNSKTNPSNKRPAGHSSLYAADENEIDATKMSSNS